MEVDGTKIIFYKADLASESDCALIVPTLDAYARDPMGGAEALSQFSKDNLITELKKRSYSHVFFAKTDADETVGMAICFEGFSSFNCKPVLNIHDFVILEKFRGKHVGRAFMTFIGEYAKTELGCCKLTLEVLEGNIGAQKAYIAAGFEPYTLSESTGRAYFWCKSLK